MPDIQAELNAVRAYIKFLKKADKCLAKFERLGKLPEVLKRFRGEWQTVGAEALGSIVSRGEAEDKA